MPPLQYRIIGRSDAREQAAYAAFIARVFPGVDFRPWISLGGWDDGYQAHTLLEGDTIVANVSVSSLRLWISGAPTLGLQIGAVGVLPAWRGRGLIRELWARALPDEGAFAFLFANRSVLELYPRLGLTRVTESGFGVALRAEPRGGPLARLDISHAADRARLLAAAARAVPTTERFGAEGYGSIALFHALQEHRRHLYVAPAHEALLVASEEAGVLTIYDVFAPRRFELAELVPALIRAPIGRVEFRFSPELWWATAVAHPIDDGAYLFVRSRLPMPSAPLRFPELART